MFFMPGQGERVFAWLTVARPKKSSGPPWC